jgi:hypothetical protein
MVEGKRPSKCEASSHRLATFLHNGWLAPAFGAGSGDKRWKSQAYSTRVGTPRWGHCQPEALIGFHDERGHVESIWLADWHAFCTLLGEGGTVTEFRRRAEART